MALRTDQINYILKTNPYTMKHFIGTFPSCGVNELTTKKKTYCFITNDENCSESGNHWNAWIVKNNTMIFFDSFGRNVYDATFPHEYKDFARKFSRLTYFKKKMQGFESKCCGYFCIHFLVCIQQGI